MKVKEDNEKAGLKLSNQKAKITASGPITSWQIDGKTVETMANFIFLGSKITADGVHWDDPEGWYREGGGRRVQDGEHMYTCGGFILIFGKTNTVM